MTVRLTKPTLLLEGGPLDGRGFHVEDFFRVRECESRMGNDRLHSYRYDRDEIHPQTGGSRGGQTSQRWVWNGPEVKRVQPRVDRSRCTFLGCTERPTREMKAHDSRVPWLGCDTHAPAMSKALGHLVDDKPVRRKASHEANPTDTGEGPSGIRPATSQTTIYRDALPREIPPEGTRMRLVYDAVKQLGGATIAEVKESTGIGGHVAVMLGAMAKTGLLTYDHAWGIFEVA